MSANQPHAAQAEVINAPVGGRSEYPIGAEVTVQGGSDEQVALTFRKHAVVVKIEHGWQYTIRLDDGTEHVVGVGNLHRWCTDAEIDLARRNAIRAGYKQVDHGWYETSSSGRSGWYERDGFFPLGLVDDYGHNQPPCPECGIPAKRGQRFCFTCSFWLSQMADRKNAVVIAGAHYRIGTGTTGAFRGFGGRTFQLAFTDGRKVTTSDLWFQGDIPERFRDRLPDDCQFMPAAHRIDVKHPTTLEEIEAMDINELATGGGKAIDFDTVGVTIEGTLTSVGDWREIDGKFGVKIKAPFNMVVDNEDRTIWVPKGSRLATVLGDAMKAAGLDRVVPGGTLKVQRVDDVPTNKGNAMHDFKARYTPAVVSVGANLDDF